MLNFKRWLQVLIVCLSIATWIVPALAADSDHVDALVVNPNLQLHDVLEKTIARNPMQASIQSREQMVTAKALIAHAILPSTPAMIVAHQNDGLTSGRNEREWLAEVDCRFGYQTSVAIALK